VLGGAVSASCANAVLGRAPDAPLRTSTPLLEGGERATLDAAVDRILPATATPGGLEAGVPDFIEFVLAEGYDDVGRRRFHDGLAALDAAALARHGATFAALAPESRDEVLAAAEQEELAALAAGGGAGGALLGGLVGGIPVEKPFFATLKELCVVGFFTSEVGGTQVFAFQPWPGGFDGCATREPGTLPPFPTL